ncbi:MAG: hypothetical protein ACYTFG_03380, partial [Planctomycetota bacterium]
GPSEEPIIVMGEFGLGKVLFVGTSLCGRWGSDWQAWDELPKWVGQALRWVKRRPEKPLPPRVTFARIPGGGIEARVETDPAAIAPEEPPMITVKLGDAPEPTSIPVLRAGTHNYRARLPTSAIRAGSTLRVEFPPGAGSVLLETEVPLPVPPPFEMGFRTADRAGLEAISLATRGLFDPDPDQATRIAPRWRDTIRPLRWIPLGLAIVLLPFPALLRRLRPAV